MACFSPVSSSKETVAWKRFPCLSTSSVSDTSTDSLFSWMRSSARSRLSQKLISCSAVPLEGSRSSLVTFWISLTHLDTRFCRALRKVESSMRSPSSGTLGFLPAASAALITCCTLGCTVSEISGMSMFCWRCSSPISSSAIFFSIEVAILSPSRSALPDSRTNDLK